MKCFLAFTGAGGLTWEGPLTGNGVVHTGCVGHNGNKIRKGVFRLVDLNGNFLKWIDENELTEALVDDLLSADYGNFSVRWNEFLAEFQKWLGGE